MLTNLTLFSNSLTWFLYLCPPHTSRQQSMHLFGPKMSRKLSIMDFIQQHLLTKRQHHQSRLLFWAFIDEIKSMFRHHMKLSMTPTCLTSQLPHFSIWWIPCSLTNTCQKGGFNHQWWNKGLFMFFTSTNLLKTTWDVISHSKCWAINWKLRNKQSGIFQLQSQHSQRIPMHKWILGPLVLAHNISMLSLQLPSLLNRVTIYWPAIRTREWYQLISTCNTNLSSFKTTLLIHMGSHYTQPSL